MPVYVLLGGKVQPSLPAYASWLYATEDLDALAREAASWAAQGFTAVKQRLPYGPLDGPRASRRNVELVQTVVEAVGPDVDVMADAYMSWDVELRGPLHPGDRGRRHPAALDRGARDPRRRRRPRAHPRGRSTPVAAGEHEATRYGFRDLVTAGAVDVLQPDVNRLGGITEARRIWALGETFGLEVSRTSVSRTTRTWRSRASRRRCSSTCRLPPPPTTADEDQIFWVAFPDEPRADDGRVTLSDRPGLGVSLDRAVLEAMSAALAERH